MKTGRSSTRYIRRERAAGKRFAALLLPDAEEVFANQRYYGRMLESLSAGLLEEGIMLRPMQCLHAYQKEHFLATPERFYVGVAILGPLYTARSFVEAVVERMVGPKVLLDHHLEGLRMHSVREDAVKGMRRVTEYLLSLGHREFGYIDVSDPEGNPWKRQGVNAALRDAGVAELGRGKVAGCRVNYLDVVAALDWFEGLDPRPTALICSDDTRAMLLLQAATERGMRVPGDISITGFGDYMNGPEGTRCLTSLADNPVEMGREAARLLAGDPEAEPVSVLVAPDLVVRGTSGPPGPDRGAAAAQEGGGEPIPPARS